MFEPREGAEGMTAIKSEGATREGRLGPNDPRWNNVSPEARAHIEKVWADEDLRDSENQGHA